MVTLKEYKSYSLTMYVVKEKQQPEYYKEIMPKIIRKWKKKYNLNEYLMSLEMSSDGHLHVHMYVQMVGYVLAIESDGNEVARTHKGSMHFKIIESEADKERGIKYILKAPLVLGVCQSYKEKYKLKGGVQKVGFGGQKLEKMDPNSLITKGGHAVISTPELDHSGRVISKMDGAEAPLLQEPNSLEIFSNFNSEGLLKEPKIGCEKDENFIWEEPIRGEALLKTTLKTIKSQRDLENALKLKSITELQKQSKKNYKQQMIVFQLLVSYFEDFIPEKKDSKPNVRKMLLLNLAYIALQLEDVAITDERTIYTKIGFKASGYYGFPKEFYKNIFEKYQEELKEQLKGKEGKAAYNALISFAKKRKEGKEYIEKVYKLGVHMFKILEKTLYERVYESGHAVKICRFTQEIKEKIMNREIVISKLKMKLPMLEKPVMFTKEELSGGWHDKDLKKPLVKETFDGHSLKIESSGIYSAVNKLQDVEYEINREFLAFVLENKQILYDILLENVKFDEKKYKSSKNQYDITLEIAQFLATKEKFYFTYEMDYRGRLYSVGDYFNYQGNKLARSLIRWHKPKYKNVEWLKITCSALYLGVVGKSFKRLLDYYDVIDVLNLEQGYVHIKHANEPIMWLSFFYEMKTNKTSWTKQMIGLDATCSGSQLVSMLLNEFAYLKYLNLGDGDKVYDYYSHMYAEYGGFPGVKEGHGRKLVKRAIMTINYGLTRIGCQRKMYMLLREYGYCKDWVDYKGKGNAEINKFYTYLKESKLVKGLDILQKVGNLFCEKKLTYEFKCGRFGFNKYNYDMISKTFTYKKYYRNFSIYNGKNKASSKGWKFKGHHKTLDIHEQKRKVKANMIHMMDASGNLSVCYNYNKDIACIHDCHAIHSQDVEEYNKTVRFHFLDLFSDNNQYYKLLDDMIENYYLQTKDELNYKLYKGLIYDNCYVMPGRLVKMDKFAIMQSKYMFMP